MESVWTWDKIIDALGGTGEVAEALVESTSTVSGWRSRPRGIPAERWAELIRLAAAKQRPDITLEVFAEVAARRSQALESRA